MKTVSILLLLLSSISALAKSDLPLDSLCQVHQSKAMGFTFPVLGMLGSPLPAQAMECVTSFCREPVTLKESVQVTCRSAFKGENGEFMLDATAGILAPKWEGTVYEIEKSLSGNEAGTLTFLDTFMSEMSSREISIQLNGAQDFSKVTNLDVRVSTTLRFPQQSSDSQSADESQFSEMSAQIESVIAQSRIPQLDLFLKCSKDELQATSVIHADQFNSLGEMTWDEVVQYLKKRRYKEV